MSKRKIHNTLIIETMFMASIATTWGVLAQYWWLSVLGMTYQALVLIAQFVEPKKEEKPKQLALPKIFGLPQCKGGHVYGKED